MVALLLVFVGLCGVNLACAQPSTPLPNTVPVGYLVLERTWPLKRIRFYPGQKLAFKLKEARGWNLGTIQAVHKNTLVILDTKIPFQDIRRIRVPRADYLGGFASLSANSLIGGGILWIGLGGIREIEGRGEGGKWLAGAGAGAILLGLATRELTRQTWHIGRNYRLRSF